MQVLCVHGPRKSKPRVKSELCKQQFLTTIIWHTQEFLGKYKNLCVTLQFCLVLFWIWGQVPSKGLYSEGGFNGGRFLRYEFRGLIHKGAYFRNFTVFNLYNSENKPRALYFSKAFFERFIFRGAYTAVGGAYLRKEICVSKSIGLVSIFLFSSLHYIFE